MLELDDIQSAVLRPRPTPYQATYVIFRIDDSVKHVNVLVIAHRRQVYE